MSHATAICLVLFFIIPHCPFIPLSFFPSSIQPFLHWFICSPISSLIQNKKRTKCLKTDTCFNVITSSGFTFIHSFIRSYIFPLFIINHLSLKNYNNHNCYSDRTLTFLFLTILFFSDSAYPDHSSSCPYSPPVSLPPFFHVSSVALFLLPRQ